MACFERKVDLLKLVGVALNSPGLASFLKDFGAREFYYTISINHYLPAKEGNCSGKPEDCYEGEDVELEFSPDYPIESSAARLMRDLKKRLKKHRDYNCFNNFFSYVKWFSYYYAGSAILWLFRENITSGFVAQENEWLESDAAYAEAFIAAKARDFDPD
jgi:hypothetical protein